ncbi:MAG: cobalamin-dependent protein [Betaproteobacteria bacterium]|nr:cobalamin-dependent protein [Betaproteobacteria bacterium]
MKTIYFADLTHTAQGIHAKCMPLGAALVASYIKREFKGAFDVSLFKIPKDLERAVLEKCPDILCLSNYAWNLRLTAAFARLVKRINPQLIIIFGGPNFPHKESERQDFLNEYDCLDFYIFGEGEMALANLLREIIKHNFDVAKIKTAKARMINCSYLTNDKNEVVSGEWTRTVELDQFPCPYTEGLMDKFFELPLIPLYETTRGCPFSCTFCTDGINEKSKVFRKSHQNIQSSISYISNHIKHSDTLIIADLNFGMYDEDIDTAEIIAQQKKTTGFPLSLGTALGKSRPEKIMQAVKIMDGSLHIGLSFQSTDPDVLKNIKRKNIPTLKLIEAAEDIGLRDSVDFTEVILGLPGDSLEKHYLTLREGVDLGMTNIRMYQLMLLVGSTMNSPESRVIYGMQTRWRVMPNCAGVYRFFDTELRVAEIEEIVVANNTMTFDDYVECRVMDFVVEVFVNNDWYIELFELLKLHGLKVFDFLVFIKENRKGFPTRMAEIFDSFVKDTCKDIFAEKKDIEAYILGKDVLEKHVSGELGNNEILDHKALCYLNFKETTKFIFEMSRNFLGAAVHVDDTLQLYLADLEKFILCRKNNVIDVESALTEQFDFDFKLVSQAHFRVEPHSLVIAKNKLRFFHDEKQSSSITKASKLYGTSVSGLGRFIQNNKMNRMFRQFESCP